MYLSRLILNPRSREARRDLGNCHDLHRTVMRGFPDVRGGAPGGNGEVRAQLGVLFRLETHPRTGVASVLVQSRVKPDWSGLPDGYLMETGGQPPNPECKRVEEAFGAIVAGDELLFRLRANPTKRLAPVVGPDGVRRDGKRVELRTEEELLRWLGEKGMGNGETGRPGAGFRLVEVRARPGVVAPGSGGGALLSVADARTRSAGKVTGLALRASAGVADVEAAVAVAVAAGSGVPTGAAVRQRLTFGDVLFEGRLLVTDGALFRQALVGGIGSGKAYGFGLLSVARGAG